MTGGLHHTSASLPAECFASGSQDEVSLHWEFFRLQAGHHGLQMRLRVISTSYSSAPSFASVDDGVNLHQRALACTSCHALMPNRLAAIASSADVHAAGCLGRERTRGGWRALSQALQNSRDQPIFAMNGSPLHV